MKLQKKMTDIKSPTNNAIVNDIGKIAVIPEPTTCLLAMFVNNYESRESKFDI